MIALYDGLIRSTDDQLARFFAGLREMGLYDRASIFVTADHGESFGEHGVYLHGHHLYETHLRIPLLVRAPWIRPEVRGSYSSLFTQQIDLFPTFASLAGAPVTAGLRGVSLIDALRDRSTLPVPRPVFAEYRCFGIHRVAVRTRRYKLVRQLPVDLALFDRYVKRRELFPSLRFGGERLLLFDMLADPSEERDLIEQHDSQVGRWLQLVLQQELDRVDAPVHRVGDLDPTLVEELRALGYFP
jgi:arylsulfatase A-like enzyme